nr:hypothetical protein BaRGS_025086 [Batillaria attramentaria]
MEKDTGKLWRLTKSLNEDTTTTNRTTVLKEDDTLYTGKKAANLLADVFEMESTIKVPPQGKKEVATQLHNRLKEQTTPTTAMTSDLSLAELNDAIRRLKTKKAPGKRKKDPAKKTSYRPISLLSCLGKTLERMINKRLMWHLESNNLITKEQTAFRKNRSTEDQLVYLAQSIENAFQEKKKVVATFIDLSKAFDKVTARVKLDSSLSHTVKIREGVPKGGVISPTLFVVFINDISSSLSRHISRALHADDFAMWNASESTSSATVRMQEALNTTSKWATDWCVTINSQKTVATCFSLSNTKETLRLTINNQQIPQEDTPTYLGTKLDKKLTWNPHIREMEKRATKRLSLMKKLAGTKWGANSSILKRVYIGNHAKRDKRAYVRCSTDASVHEA